MHGILFKQLHVYVSEEWDDGVWRDAMAEADIEPKLYLPVTEYPDEEALALFDAVTTLTETDEIDLFSDLGEQLAETLLDTFKAHVRDEWDVMDLLEHADEQVLSVLHSTDGPDDEVTASREDENTVVVEYDSPLGLCAMLTGVLRGIVETYDENAEITERACVHRGADACEITVSRT